MLRVSDMWVSPAEVEERLLSHEAVAQAVVVAGLDADRLGKLVAASHMSRHRIRPLGCEGISSTVRSAVLVLSLVLTSAGSSDHLPAETAHTSTSFTIFEGTSEVQRMIIGRAVTGLDVR